MSSTVEALVGRYLLDLKARGYSPATLEGYRLSLNRLCRFLTDREIEQPQEVSARVLADYQTDVLVREGRGRRPLTMVSQAHLLGQARQFFRYLAKKGYLLVNPAQDLEIPRCVRRPPDRVLDLASTKRLLLAPDTATDLGLRDRAILELLYSTGLRVGELVGLDVVDIHLLEEELRVRRGKGGKSRQLPVGKIACRWLSRYLKEVRPRLLVRPSEHALFLSCRGRRLHPYNLWKAMKRYARDAGIEMNVSPHVMRHTFATHMLRGRASLRHLQELLGHARLTTTQIYTKVEISDLKEVHRRCHPRGRG